MKMANENSGLSLTVFRFFVALVGAVMVAMTRADAGAFPDESSHSMGSSKKIDTRTIVVEDETVTLDAAYCFQVWNGSKPDYPPSEDENLTNLRAYLEQIGDEARLSHLDWVVDFVIRFDKDVAKGDVSLYGQLDPLFPDWVDFNEISTIPSLKANEEFRLLNFDFITYGLALEMLENFNCGVSSRLYGTTITVDLNLYDPAGSAEPLTIASCHHKFERPNLGKWFDAHIADYRSWPGDAGLASGGFWRSSVPLNDAASVSFPGELEVNANAFLEFVADESRPIGSRSDETVVEADVELFVCAATKLPPVSIEDKGGVILVRRDGVLYYYGLAKVESKNEWVELEGPEPDCSCESAHLKMSFRRENGKTLVKYAIGGIEYAYEGRQEIPVVANGEVKGVGCSGDGTVCSLFASAPEPKRGLLLYLK